MAVVIEQVSVVDTERLVAADVDLQLTEVVEQFQDGHFGRNQLHVARQKRATRFSVKKKRSTSSKTKKLFFT